jgi:predicted metal-dependent HD superfamily phosphohydrolase
MELTPPKLVTKETHDALVVLYNQPHRAYHNLNHIADCQSVLRTLQEKLPLNEEDILRIETMIWFHDAIYDVGEHVAHGANEKNSAQFFFDNAQKFQSHARIEIGYGIYISAHHTHGYPPGNAEHGFHGFVNNERAEGLTPNSLIFMDIDLCGMGGYYDTFMHNGDNIRKEYAWAPEPQFTQGRRKFFTALLNCRPHIYYNEVMRELFESNTRYNISRWLKESE